MTHHQALEFIRQQIADEFALINSRLAGFAGCQAFLITGFALSLGNAFIYRAGWLAQWVLPTLGACLCLAVMPGVHGAGRTIDEWRARQHALLSDTAARDALRDVTIARFLEAPAADRLHRRSLWFSTLLPTLLLLFWLVSFALLRLRPVVHPV